MANYFNASEIAFGYTRFLCIQFFDG